VVLVAAVGAGGYFGYQWLMTSDRFAVKEIEVRGTERTNREQVLELASISRGDNIFRLGRDDIERALEHHPWIRRASVTRQLPRRLIIDIEENQPAAVVELDGLYLADATGAVFKRAEVDKGETSGLPVITGIGRDEYLSDPDAAQAKIRRGLEIHRTYHDRADRPSLGEIHFDPHRGLTLVTYDNAVAIRLGRAKPAQLDGRLAGFDAAWKALSGAERANVRVIHLDDETAPRRVTVAFASGPK
jgi:cell division protein FtsQ